MALLEMINSVRGKLREERIGAISISDPLTTEIIDLINDSGSEILEGNDWEFDVRTDGDLFYPSSQSGTQLTFNALQVHTNLLNAKLIHAGDAASGEVFEDVAAIDLAGFRCSGGRRRARVIVTDSPNANTSWIVSTVDLTATAFQLNVSSNFHMAVSGNYAWTTYANELVLPTTVKDVLSVRNEEEPVRLEFTNRAMEFDRWVPRQTDHYGTQPEIVIVGGMITSTERTHSGAEWLQISDEAAVTGTGCMVWPIPNADLHLQYTYRVQHSDLAVATDEWAGVPANIIHLISLRAFQMALDSGIQNDPQAAARVERQVEKRLLRAQMKQSRQPNLRRVPTSFGMQPRGSTRGRWATQSITASS